MYNLAVKNHYHRESRFKRDYLKITISVLLIATLIIFFYDFSSLGGKPVRYLEVRVEKGDTLWSIAKNYNQINDDPRKIINQIKKVNGLENVILQPGQVIKIPQLNS
ncbi:MAG: hypothetical protein PWR10_1238 [Halanaerobiales bacterium]|nr:hypothetical protein [Halanaerobiales bacterium]